MKARNAHAMEWGTPVFGLAASFATLVILLAARSGDEGLAWVRVIPAFVLLNGGLVAAFHARRLWALLAGMVAGLATGIASTWGLVGQPVDGVFSIITVTLAFFITLGLLFGGFIEFVLYLHHLAHGRPAREYQKAPRMPSNP